MTRPSKNIKPKNRYMLYMFLHINQSLPTVPQVELAAPVHRVITNAAHQEVKSAMKRAHEETEPMLPPPKVSPTQQQPMAAAMLQQQMQEQKAAYRVNPQPPPRYSNTGSVHSQALSGFEDEIENTRFVDEDW